MPMTFDIQQLLNQSAQAMDESTKIATAAAGALTADTARVQDLSTINVATGEQAIDVAADSAGKRAGAEYTQNKARETAQNMLNLNPDVLENELQRSINMLNAGQAAYREARPEYDRLASIAITDNPFGYIMAQLKLPQVAAKVNAAADLQTAAEQNISTRTGMLENFSRTVKANTAATLQDAAIGDAKAASLEAKVKLGQVEMQNISRVSGMELQKVQISNIVNDNRSKQISMELAAMTAADKRTELNLKKSEWNMLQEERLKKMQTEAAAKAELNIGLKRVAGLFGLAVAPTVETLSSYPVRIRQPLLNAALSGQFGADLKDSMQVIAQIPAAKNIGQTNPGAGLFLDQVRLTTSKYERRVEREMLQPGAVKLKAADIPLEAADLLQHDYLASANQPNFPKPLSHPEWDGTFHPYKANHKMMLDNVAAGTLPSLQNNEFVAALKTVASALPIRGEDIGAENEQRALRVIRDKVAAHQLDPEIAARQVSAYYRTAANMNLATYQYNMFGLPVQEKYNFTMQPASMFDPALPVDLMNPASIKNAFMKDARRQEAYNKFTFGQGIAGFR